MIIAETNRMVLRLLDENIDANMILELLNQPSFLNNIGDKKVRNLDDAKGYINSGPLAMQVANGYSMYCCVNKKDQQPIGMCGLIKREGVDHPEIGFSLLENHFRQGYGKESSLAVLKHTKNKLNITVLNALTALHNTASINLLTSIGFKYQRLIDLPSIEDTCNLFKINL